MRAMSATHTTDQSSAVLYRRLLRYLLPYKWVFAVAVVGMFVVALG